MSAPIISTAAPARASSPMRALVPGAHPPRIDCRRERCGALAAVPALVMDQVCKSFGAGVPGCGAKVRVLAAASLVVNAGEIVGIAGGPGSGKSTLLRCAAGMMRPEYGSVAWLAAGSGSARAETHLPLYLDLRDTIPRGEIERAIASGARLLLVDHATPLLLDELRAAITRSQSLRLRGAIVIASRSSRELARVASRVLVLSEGRLPGLS